MKKKLILHVDYDPDVPSPEDDSGWRLHSFSQRHGPRFLDPATILRAPRAPGEIRPKGQAFRRQLERGTAFVVSWFSHSGELWFLPGEHSICRSPDFRWDGVTTAGLVRWERDTHDKELSRSVEARRGQARDFLEQYTHWINGENYCWAIEDSQRNFLDGCGGYRWNDLDYMRETIQAALEELGPSQLRVTGDLDELARKWFPRAKTATRREVYV